MYIVKIDVQKCTGDGECVDACPSTLFELQAIEGKKIAVFSDPNEDCLGCEACVTTCPSESIILTES